MATAIILPKLDEAMRTGKIVKWLKKEGDLVKKGEGVVQIETEKVTFEIEAEGSGILGKIMAQEGEELPVGTIIAYIIQPGEKVPEAPVLVATAREAARTQKPVTVPKEEARAKVFEAPTEGRAIKASPLAKRIAREHNIDITSIRGTGPSGRIVREDVLRAMEESKVAVARPTREEVELAEEQVASLSSMRKVIARRMTESFQSPHFYLTVEVETQELMKTNKQLVPLIENKIGIRSTITDLLIKMVAKALEDNPSMNCAYFDGSVKLFKRIDIGLVTSVEGGLVVPVIRQANRKSLTEIARARAELVQKARERKLSMAEMKGSTFTLSNLGMYGIDQFSAILQPPEAAILAVGRIADKAVVRDGQIVIRPMMTMTLSIDHRVLDGTIGAQFLKSLKDYIENPALMFYSVLVSP
ncbi:MAG: dihydrolipoamide acetyltransferase family protein [Chloroflexi bacterium]|nr:dihydrolipoamide acetyltransferase family protein [Chloroflexota bacterium]